MAYICDFEIVWQISITTLVYEQRKYDGLQVAMNIYNKTGLRAVVWQQRKERGVEDSTCIELKMMLHVHGKETVPKYLNFFMQDGNRPSGRCMPEPELWPPSHRKVVWRVPPLWWTGNCTWCSSACLWVQQFTKQTKNCMCRHTHVNRSVVASML